MNLNLNNWSEKEYDQFLNYLKELGSDELIKFNSKLIFTKYEMIGIKLPKLREISKEIFKGNYIEFLKYSKNKYYEEVMIEGFIIAKIKDENIFDDYFYKHINKIDNWSLCDSFCNSLKQLRGKDKYFNIFKKLAKSKKEFYVRVGLIGILSNFVNDDYIDEIFNILDNIKEDKYYIKMAVSWLLCECFIKQRDKTMKYLNENKLDDFSFNKGIQKCLESFRVSEDDKKYLRSIKR